LVIPFTPLLEIPPLFGGFAFTVLYRIHFATFFLFTYSNSNGAVMQSKTACIQRQFMKALWRKGGASFWAAGCGVIRAQGLAPHGLRVLEAARAPQGGVPSASVKVPEISDQGLRVVGLGAGLAPMAGKVRIE
jgi:hypothetical protein